METWREVASTAGRYSVSSVGRVRANWSDVPRRGETSRVRIEKSTLLSPYTHTTGYLRINLGRTTRKYVHRLVATAFIPNPDSKPYVDHIDGNRQNNEVSNLRWVTGEENAAHGGERHNWKSQKLANRRRRVHEQRASEYTALLAEGLSLREIARRYGTSHSAVAYAVRNY